MAITRNNEIGFSVLNYLEASLNLLESKYIFLLLKLKKRQKVVETLQSKSMFKEEQIGWKKAKKLKEILKHMLVKIS